VILLLRFVRGLLTAGWGCPKRRKRNVVSRFQTKFSVRITGLNIRRSGPSNNFIGVSPGVRPTFIYFETYRAGINYGDIMYLSFSSHFSNKQSSNRILIIYLMEIRSIGNLTDPRISLHHDIPVPKLLEFAFAHGKAFNIRQLTSFFL
jgi:hypothetical protein